VHLTIAGTDTEYRDGRLLFEEYAAQLGVSLCFQDFAHELDSLPAMYGPPGGRLIIARGRGELAGCVAVRAASEPGTCEMKRLYVRDRFRGRGLGRRLATEAITAGRELGYRRMVLDTLGRMTAALALYADLGFTETSPYYANPNADVRYLALPLAPSRPR
jgi:putative acetyltransferase